MAMMMLAAVGGGCVPTEQGVRWSPDGTRGLVMGSDGVHVCDVTGALTGPTIPGAALAVWMPDGKHAVVLQSKELKNWKEIEAAFPDEVANIKEKANEMVKQIAEVDQKGQAFESLSLTAGLMSFFLQYDRPEATEQMELMFFYLRDEKPETIQGKLSAVWDDAMRYSITRLVAQVYDVNGPEAKEGATVAWLPGTNMGGSFDRKVGFDMMSVSSTGQAVAIYSHGSSEVIVAATNGSGVRMKRKAAMCYPAWTADGKYLVYITPMREGEGKELGVLTRRKMVDDQGVLLKKGLESKEMPEEETLATLFLSGGDSRVCVLKDGRIFFTTADVKKLPATRKETEAWRPVLFSFKGGSEQGTLSRVMSPETEKAIYDEASMNGKCFDVSPDGQHISLLGNNGQVTVLDVDTGNLHQVQQDRLVTTKDQNQGETVSLPSWRTADELTFACPRSDGKGNELVRYSLTSKEVTVISRSWPIEVTNGWLDKKVEATPATKQPEQPRSSH